MGRYTEHLKKRMQQGNLVRIRMETGKIAPNSKGIWGGLCNRSACLAPGAQWYNHGSNAYYCHRCAIELSHDSFNKMDAERTWGPGKLLCEFQPTSEPLEPRKWLNL